jgi:hypothetical protein
VQAASGQRLQGHAKPGSGTSSRASLTDRATLALFHINMCMVWVLLAVTWGMLAPEAYSTTNPMERWVDLKVHVRWSQGCKTTVLFR